MPNLRKILNGHYLENIRATVVLFDMCGFIDLRMNW